MFYDYIMYVKDVQQDGRKTSLATCHCTLYLANKFLSHTCFCSTLLVYDLNTTQINTTQQQTQQCRSLTVSSKSFCNEMTYTLLGLYTLSL